MSFKEAYIETPVTKTKSLRKLVRDEERKAIESIKVSSFVWVKTLQYKWQIIAVLFVSQNAYMVYHFIKFGVN